MGIEEAQTEQLIKDKAKDLFFKKGYLKATTQEIADEAGVNRALIHYYFRSREQMLDILMNEALSEKKQKVRAILSSEIPFREKIANYIETMVDFGVTYPYFENFIISELARQPEKLTAFCSLDSVKTSDLIRKDLEEEIRLKKIAPIEPGQFLVNLISLCNYPLLAKPILKTIHGMTDETYLKFLIERKQIIYMSIFNEEMPQPNKK